MHWAPGWAGQKSPVDSGWQGDSGPRRGLPSSRCRVGRLAPSHTVHVARPSCRGETHPPEKPRGLPTAAPPGATEPGFGDRSTVLWRGGRRPKWVPGVAREPSGARRRTCRQGHGRGLARARGGRVRRRHGRGGGVTERGDVAAPGALSTGGRWRSQKAPVRLAHSSPCPCGCPAEAARLTGRRATGARGARPAVWGPHGGNQSRPEAHLSGWFLWHTP